MDSLIGTDLGALENDYQGLPGVQHLIRICAELLLVLQSGAWTEYKKVAPRDQLEGAHELEKRIRVAVLVLVEMKEKIKKQPSEVRDTLDQMAEKMAEAIHRVARSCIKLVVN